MGRVEPPCRRVHRRSRSRAHAGGVPVYLDGARIFNAAVAQSVDVLAFTRHVDLVMFCISKGLASPVGSLLCGPRDLILQARHLRYVHGGSMRQAGLLAACGIISLETMVERLGEDHVHARWIAEELALLPGVAIDLDLVQTNMVYADVGGAGVHAPALAERLEQQGVQILALATPSSAW